MKNKKAIYIVGTIILLLILILFIWFFFFKEEEKTVTEVKAIDNIEKFGYILYENKTDLYKDKFNELKEVLNNEEINETKYAELLAQLFVTDFYTLENKVTNTDIGGIDFIHPEGKETFRLAAGDTIYKYIENNVYGDREQDLPEVSNVEVKSNEQQKYESDNVKDENGYVISLDIEYVEDLEYPTSVTLTIVHDESKLYIVEVK